MGLVFAAIAPHGSMAIAEACAPEQLTLAAATRAAMEELGRRFEAARPEAAIVLTPHNVHVEGAMAVVVAGSVAGALSDTTQAGDLSPTWKRTKRRIVISSPRRFATWPTCSLTLISEFFLTKPWSTRQWV